MSDETTRLRAELAAERERANEVTAEHAELFDLLLAAEARVAKLREALEPFARCVQKVGPDADAVFPDIANTHDYLNARAVLEETGGGDENK